MVTTEIRSFRESISNGRGLWSFNELEDGVAMLQGDYNNADLSPFEHVLKNGENWWFDPQTRIGTRKHTIRERFAHMRKPKFSSNAGKLARWIPLARFCGILGGLFYFVVGMIPKIISMITWAWNNGPDIHVSAFAVLVFIIAVLLAVIAWLLRGKPRIRRR